MIESSLSGNEPKDVQRVASRRLKNQPTPTNPEHHRQGALRQDVDTKFLDELRKNARLYMEGGGIHFGIPREEW